MLGRVLADLVEVAEDAENAMPGNLMLGLSLVLAACDISYGTR